MEVWGSGHPRWSQLVRIDIIRRDTLAASQSITSPLQRLVAHYDLDPAAPAGPGRNLPPNAARILAQLDARTRRGAA